LQKEEQRKMTAPVATTGGDRMTKHT